MNVSSGAGANAGGENIPLNNSNPYSANTKDIMAKKSDDVSDDDYSFESSSTASVFVMIAVAMVIFVNICKKKN